MTMMNWTLLAAIFFISSFTVASSRESLSCRNEEGTAVDWFIVYKIPYLQKDPNDKLRSGFAYAYISGPSLGSSRRQNGQQGWTLSKKLITDNDSIFAQTLKPLFRDTNSYTHLIYSDAPSDNSFGKDSNYLAHAKGVVALEPSSYSSTGFWLIHSVPQFPDPPSHSHSYSYPQSGRDNGQSAICISISVREARKVVSQLLYMRANVYSNVTDRRILVMIPEIEELLEREWPKSPTESIVDINTLGGRSFKSFSRSPKSQLRDLYVDIMAPELKTDLLVETWRRGAGTPLTSNCTYQYKVNNVESVELFFPSGSPVAQTSPWSYLEDHSKWAVSISADKPLTCVGDINRMASQAKRGGGSLCLDDTTVWKATTQSVHDVENCPRNSNRQNTNVPGKTTKKPKNTSQYDLSGGKFGFVPSRSNKNKTSTSRSYLIVLPLIALLFKYISL